MLKSTRWFARELERRDRAHAQQLDAERAAWRDERAQLVETICALAGKPTYELPEPRDEDTDPSWLLEPLQEPADQINAGDGLLTYQPEEG